MPNWIPRLSYEIVIDPEHLSVADGTNRVEIEPRVWISDDGRIVGIGRNSEGSGRPIDLFDPAAPADPARFDVLVKLLRYLFMRLQDNQLFRIRPWVRVHGIVSLQPLLNGYEQEVVRQALLQAGASNVRFAA